jgi:hypothetical protein
MGMKHNIELHIEKLVLHGFERIDGFRMRAALETEFARLFTEIGVPSSLSRSGKFARLDGGTFNMTPNSRAEGIATNVAQVVYRELDQ